MRSIVAIEHFQNKFRCWSCSWAFICTLQQAVEQCNNVKLSSGLFCIANRVFNEKQHYKCKTRDPFRLYKEWYIHATNIQLNLRCYNVGQYHSFISQLIKKRILPSSFLPSFPLLLCSKNNKDDRPSKARVKNLAVILWLRSFIHRQIVT